MANSPVLALGSFQFSTSTAAFESLQRTSSWDWPEQKRVGAVPVLQFAGKDAETITLPGVIYPLHNGAGLSQLETLRTAADKGEPLVLADNKGKSWGRWCIRSITEEQTDLLPGGAPRKQSFTITLVRYHED